MSRRARVLQVVGWVVCGLALGLVNSLAHSLGTPYSPRSLSPSGVPFLEVLAGVLGSLWAWPVVAFCVGASTRHPMTGTVAGVVTLLVADAVYYPADAWGGVRDHVDLNSMALWASMAVPAGGFMGLCGALAARRHWWAILPGLVPSALIAYVGTNTGSQTISDWPPRVGWVVCAAMACAALVRWATTMRHPRPSAA